MHVVQKPQRFNGAIPKVSAVALKRHAPPDIHIPQVHGWVSIKDPVCKNLTRTASRLNAYGVESGSDKQVAHFWCFPQQVPIVRGEALRPVEKQVDASFCERWRAVHC